jgi:hypothetical protein
MRLKSARLQHITYIHFSRRHESRSMAENILFTFSDLIHLLKLYHNSHLV